MSKKIKIHSMTEDGFQQVFPETIASQVVVEATGQTLEQMVKSGNLNGKVDKSYFVTTVETEGQTEFAFDDPEFDVLQHTVVVHLDGEFLYKDEHYTVERDGDELPKIILVRPTSIGNKLHITVEKNVLTGGYTQVSGRTTNLTTIGAHAHEGVAHRGYSATAPENTLPAYIEAKKQGFKYAEADISWSKDNVPVLLHDGTIDRTSDGTGNVADLTLSQLQLYDYGSWKDPKYVGTKIPTFHEFILLCRSIELHPYIELKGTVTPEQAAILVGIVRELKMEDKVTWISFGYDNLKNILNESPTTRLGFLTSLTPEMIALTKTLKTNMNEVFIDCSYATVTKQLVQQAAQEDLFVEAWTINDENIARRMVDLGVVGITTDVLNMENVLSKSESTLVHWKFNEPAGTPFTDKSGNNHTATLVGGATVVPGLVGDGGNGIKGNGVDGYVLTNFNLAGRTNFKLSMYFKLNFIKPFEDEWGWVGLFSNYRTIVPGGGSLSNGFYISIPKRAEGSDESTVVARCMTTAGGSSVTSSAKIRVGVTYKIIADYNGFDLVLTLYEMVDNQAVLLSEDALQLSGRLNTGLSPAALLTENSLVLTEHADAVIDEVKVTSYI